MDNGAIVGINLSVMAYLGLNLLVLYLLLRKILYRPLTQLMESRTREIEEGLNLAEENRRKQEQLSAEYEETIREARQEARKIVESSYVQRDELLKEARKEADRKTEEMLERARQEIEAEKKRAFDELRKEIASISVAIAGKIIEKELDQAAQEKIVNRYLEEVGRAS